MSCEDRNVKQGCAVLMVRVLFLQFIKEKKKKKKKERCFYAVVPRKPVTTAPTL